MRRRLFIAVLFAWLTAPLAGAVRPSTPGSWQGFTTTLHANWKAQQGKLSYETNSWMQRIFRHDFKNAAHLWPVIQNELPKSFENEATAAYLFALWNLNLAQTFTDAWLGALSKGTFGQSELAAHFEAAIAPQFEKWIYTQVPILNASQTALVIERAQKRRVPFIHLAAWSLLRSPDRAAPLLSALPESHGLKRYLRRSAIYYQARLGNTAEAIRLAQQDPAASPSERKLAEARLRYQAGDLAGAQKLYAEVTDAKWLKTAHEEMLWVSLRQGDITRLRGELVSVSSVLKKGEFAPDLQVIGALSNLKLCYFDRVERNLAEYKAQALIWARQIDEGLAKGTPAPGAKDLFTRLAEKRVSQLEKELKAMQGLELESLEGPLPAIGVQTHWSRLRQRLSSLWRAEQRTLEQEHRRRWGYRKAQLEDSIRKMRFVHAEFSNQVRRFAAVDPQNTAEAMSQEQAALSERTVQKKARLLQNDTNLMTFPVDEVLWEDEIFHMRSVAQTYCLRAMEHHGG